jgi:hypothetical protein
MIHVTEIEQWLDRLYIAAAGAGLRLEDRRKAREVTAMLSEIERAVARLSRKSRLVLVDAAAGKSYIGLLAAKLVFDTAGRQAGVITIERDADRVEAGRRGAHLLGSATPIDCREAEIADSDAWPKDIAIVTALHACGAAADEVIERTVAARARYLLLVPCCTSDSIPAAKGARVRADALGIPRHAPVRRRYIQAMVDAERTWRLEAAGYETEVVEFVPPTVTPHNLLWRARLVGEPQRMKRALDALEKLRVGKKQACAI